MKISYYPPKAEVVLFGNEDILTVNGSAMGPEPDDFWSDIEH